MSIMLFSVFYVGDSCQGWGIIRRAIIALSHIFHKKQQALIGSKKEDAATLPPSLKQEQLDIILRSFLGKFIQLF